MACRLMIGEMKNRSLISIVSLAVYFPRFHHDRSRPKCVAIDCNCRSLMPSLLLLITLGGHGWIFNGGSLDLKIWVLGLNSFSVMLARLGLPSTMAQREW
ncbi:hypothetical protein ACLOJK_006807, partial [Asimina triloba]